MILNMINVFLCMRRYIKITPIFIMGIYKENPMNAKEPHFFGYYLVEQEFHTKNMVPVK